MTSKLSWIAFVPFTLAALAIKVVQLFFLDENGTFMGFNSLMLSYLAIACAIVVLLFAVIFCFIDRKTAQVYLIGKNYIAGIFGLFMAAALACEGANNAFIIFRSYDFSWLTITDIVLTILSAIVFVVLGLNHFVGNGGVRGLAVFYLVPALWSAFRLVRCFLGFTTVSIAVTDVTILVCYIFTTLYLFNYSMIIALMKGKSPVRATFIFGLPSVTMLLCYGVYDIGAVFRDNLTLDVFSHIEAVEITLLGLYILSFIVELSSKVKLKSQIEIVQEDDESEEYDAIDCAESDAINSIANSVTNTDASGYVTGNENLAADDDIYIEVAQTSMQAAREEATVSDDETSDYIYGTVPEDDDYILPTDSPEVDAPEYTEEGSDLYITKADSTYDTHEDMTDEETQIDRIDKLILEISEDEFS